MRLRAHGAQVAIPRRYWPRAHDLLRHHGGRWAARTGHSEEDHAGEMVLKLEPKLGELLRQALPHGAIVDADRNATATEEAA